MECPICIDEYPITEMVKCKCNSVVCHTCAKRYLLEMTDYSPKCMNPDCKLEWGVLFIIDSLGYDFYQSSLLKVLRKNFVREEKKLLETTQREVEKINESRMTKIELCQVMNKIEDLKIEYNNTLKGIITTLPTANIDITLKNIEKMEKFHQDIVDKITVFISKKQSTIEEVVNSVKKLDINIKCSNKNCRGKLSEDYRCRLCKTLTCRDCRETILDEKITHTCKKEEVETVKFLESNTNSKNCPSCGTYIAKASGCNHMWCSECKTFFDWATLKIIKNVVSNPEYNDYISNKGFTNRVAGDMACGGIDTDSIIDTFKSQIGYSDREIESRVYSIKLYVEKIDSLLQNRYSNNSIESSKLKLRNRYITNVIDEKQWETQLGKLYKLESFSANISPILQDTIDCIVYLSRNISIEETLDNNKYHLQSIYTLVDEMSVFVKDLYKKYKYKVNDKILKIDIVEMMEDSGVSGY